MFKVVRVQYTAKQEYVPRNKENISRVMKDLREINNPVLNTVPFCCRMKKHLCTLPYLKMKRPIRL
jgi:hypothetical protein